MCCQAARGREAGEVAGLVLRPERGGESRTVEAAGSSQGLGHIPLQLHHGLLEAVVRVGETE